VKSGENNKDKIARDPEVKPKTRL